MGTEESPTEMDWWNKTQEQRNYKTGVFVDQFGDKIYLVDGKAHRNDGPALIWSHGITSWYLDGIQYTEEEHKRKIVARSSTLGKLILSDPIFKLDSGDGGVAK